MKKTIFYYFFFLSNFALIVERGELSGEKQTIFKSYKIDQKTIKGEKRDVLTLTFSDKISSFNGKKIKPEKIINFLNFKIEKEKLILFFPSGLLKKGMKIYLGRAITDKRGEKIENVTVTI